MQRATHKEIPHLVANREPFKGNSTWADYYHYAPPTGYLPEEHAKQLLEDFNARTTSAPIYIIFSYGTPIAWVLENGTERVPYVKYSRTTSKAQGQVRYGLSLIGNYAH